MGHAPALGNVEVEPLGQRIGCGAGGGVAPGAERRQLVAVLVKGQVAVHHGRNAQGAHRGQRFAAGVPVVLGQVAVGILDAVPDFRQRVGPVPALKMVFPVVGAAGQHRTVGTCQNCLDAGRPQFNTQ